MFSHFKIVTTLCGRHCCYSHPADEKNELQKTRHPPGVSQLVKEDPDFESMSN